MQLTELREGTHVVDAHGDDLGKIERYVIDPSARTVTHVVIEKGVVFPRERVAPVDALEPTDREDRLRLDDTVAAEDLPPFEDRHYIDLEAQRDAALEPLAPYPALAWAYPTMPVAGYPAYPMVGATPMETTHNVPEGSVVVSEGVEVLADDGESVGRIKEVGTDEMGHLAYVIVDPGWFRSEQLIPSHWIQNIDETGVRLAMTAETLRRHERDRPHT